MACNNADFNNNDFNGSDFYVNKYQSKFFNMFRDILPLQLKKRDSYKDNDDRGLLERYLSLFGYYIDEDVIPEINCYLNIIDASITKSEYLNHLSDVLGNPPDVFKNEEQYRNLLSYIVSIYKIKGTKEGYSLFFSILGFNIEINEIDPLERSNLYDDGRNYDDGVFLYDDDQCVPCSEYEIKFYYKNGDPLLDTTIINLLRAAIEFNEPINAVLNNLTLIINVSDELSITTEDNMDYDLNQLLLYDSNKYYDDDDDHDVNIDIEALISHIKWDSNGEGEILYLAPALLNNLDSSMYYDLDKSYMRIRFKNGANILGESQIYNFTQPNISSGYLNVVISEDGIIIPINTDNIEVYGRIYLSNNTFYSFNDILTLNEIKFTSMYFNI